MPTEIVTSIEALRDLYPAPAERALRKQIAVLDPHCRDFIAASPFVLLATSGADGSCDVSPKGGPPGFVRVLDEHRLALPDAPGNRRLDSFTNVMANPQAGLLFLIPGLGETLRVNGGCVLCTDADILDALANDSKRPPGRARGRGRAGVHPLRQGAHSFAAVAPGCLAARRGSSVCRAHPARPPRRRRDHRAGAGGTR